MNTLKKVHSKGAAMPLAVLVGVLLLAVAVSLLSLGRHFRLQSFERAAAISAKLAADAGITRGLHGMNEILANGSLSSSALPEGKETFNDSTNRYKVYGSIASGFYVASIGDSRNSTKQVLARLRLKGLFDYGMYMKGSVDLKNGTVVDGYNYAPGDPRVKLGTMSTNSAAVVLYSSVKVKGSMMVGYGGDPDTVVTEHSGATVEDGKYAMAGTWDPPIMAVPDYLKALPSLGNINNDTTLSSNAKIDRINLSNSKVLTIDGDVELYVTGDITLGNNAHIDVVTTDPDASLTIYVEGDIEEKNGASMNNQTKDARKLSIYGQAGTQSITLKNSGQFYGTLYAPKTDIVFHNSLEFHGAIIGNTFEQKQSANFYYDANLKMVDSDSTGAQFVVERWSEEVDLASVFSGSGSGHVLSL
jgi:hypothetical protein